MNNQLIKIIILCLSFNPSLIWAAPSEEGSQNCSSILNHTFALADTATKQNLCESHQGKVILVVNTASRCGYTPQFDSLEKLYESHKDQGFVVLGFPSNDFKQELSENKEIAKFCRMKYGVSFPVFKKSSVTGDDANPLYKQLIEKSGQQPEWNFFKYLIDRNGEIIKVYPSRIAPEDPSFIKDIEALL